MRHFTYILIIKLLVVWGVLMVGILFPSVVRAGVVINEVFPNPVGEEDAEFIELYTDTDTIIKDYTLHDKTSSFTIPDITLLAGEYYVVTRAESGIQLNNSFSSGEFEEVTLKNPSLEVVDSMRYSETIEGKSWSRIPNTTGSFVNNTPPTSGATNFAPPTATPTLTPTTTATPTNSPVPTSTHTPTTTSTPTLFPTMTKAVTPTPRESLDSKEVVLGIRNEIPESSPAPADEQKVSDKSEKSFPIVAFLIVFFGLGMVGFAGYPFLKQRFLQ